MNKKIMLCAINSLSCGICDEDCAYCTQNIKSKTQIKRYKIKDENQVVNEAKIAKANHALGFCLVTSGAALDDEKTEKVASIARAVKKEVPDLMLIACNGIATKEQLKELRDAGVFSYNHNLETSQNFFKNICSTHTWEDRFLTNLNAKEVGLELCCGGIYGLGESEDDRISFRKSLKELNPFSSPINFFMKADGLGIDVPELSVDEAFEIIKQSVADLPETRIMVAGGREKILKERQYDIFDYGVAAIVLGDYLTAKGEDISDDIKELKKRGFDFLTQCH
ncbi:biotin synthetase [Campylobacter pinnipediorum subsp. caledonicus]|uniref:Biotin synthase n=1 Tax=Campylobacter pinnipediorum subsp. caledonicus TaxID=1874362 RepID=A0A1S6U7D6_9BACT|nr:biotin synthase [Campylobacter pinnipediorum]AQW85756.1 biotin synthetase [Campylobacter pinnipediorum subsp. caledonicus]AQW87367.1 biotin synthetase [Campylobacter pinnipediorum subsp. caledonicus]OPA72551.1 biotin synthase BioB [Campylobacter pinnipediorum subsp. caledonicus]